MSPRVFVLLCVVCTHQVHGRDIYITGYSGQSVILKSGANSSWNLSTVEWSIYENTTFIVMLTQGEVTLYNFWRFQGRLDLDRKTGDLTIHNVMIGDSLTYDVALHPSDGKQEQHKVHLSVQESLKKPEIQSQVLSLIDHRCYVVLNCTASGQNVNLSWTPGGEFNGLYISGVPSAADSLLVLYASFNGNKDVTFNCTASSGQQKVTRQITVGCSEETQKREVCTVCSSCTSSVILTIVLTAASLIVVYFCTKHRDKIRTVCWERLQQFIQNIRKRSNNFSSGSSDVQVGKTVV